VFELLINLLCCYAGLMFGCGGGVCMIDYNISTIAFNTFTTGTAYLSYLARLNAAVGSPERCPSSPEDFLYILASIRRVG